MWDSGEMLLWKRFNLMPLFVLCYSAVSVIIAADQSNGRSILTYQTNLDKVAKLSSHSMMGVSGPNCDLVNFTEYVLKSLNMLLVSCGMLCI